MTYLDENDTDNHPIREHSCFLPVDQSWELTPEEREVYKKISQQQVEEKENIYPPIDLYTAYHLLRKK